MKINTILISLHIKKEYYLEIFTFLRTKLRERSRKKPQQNHALLPYCCPIEAS